MNELWQPIPGFEETYEASDQGRIRSIDRVVTQPCRWAGVETISYRRKGKILRQASRKEQNSNYGRKFVNLWGGTPRQSYPTLVHHLVAFTFIGPRPKGLEIDHVNGDKTDNRACNLEYVTHAENVRRHNALKELSPWQQLPLFDRITLLPESPLRGKSDQDAGLQERRHGRPSRNQGRSQGNQKALDFRGLDDLPHRVDLEND